MRELPDFLAEVISAPALLRLKNIDMNCGLIYTSLPLFSALPPYSRYEHSLGVAALAWRFSNDQRTALSALFHDISTPAFSHVVDFMHGDYTRQEYTEQLTEALIRNEKEIMTCLKRLDIPLREVSDYHRYPIADNDSPKLSCDRLEYTLQNMARYGIESEAFVREAEEDLLVGRNEEGEEELMFQTVSTAETFALASVACGRIYSGKEDRYAMEYLARLLKEAVRKGILQEELLYLGEAEVIAILENSPMKEKWEKYRRLRAVNETEEDGWEVFAVSAKKRYIDPYVFEKGRISRLSETVRQEIHCFLEEDYSGKLRGKFDE